MGIKPASVGYIYVEPAVVVVVKECDSAALGLDDNPLMVYPSQTLGTVSPAACATSINWTREEDEVDGAASTINCSFQFQRGVARASSNAPPRTQSDDPRKRRRGSIIEWKDYK